MAKQRGGPVEWEDAWAILRNHVGAIGSPDRLSGDYGIGFVAYIPASAAPGGLAAAQADLEAEGCSVEVADLGASAPLGRWRVTVTHPRWTRGAGRGPLILAR
jgi:hypothetical protein